MVDIVDLLGFVVVSSFPAKRQVRIHVGLSERARIDPTALACNFIEVVLFL
jgi:hypothetical protein